MTPIRGKIMLLALLGLSPAWSAETGTLLKADSLRVQPFGDAKLVAALPAGNKVTILKKNGGWLQVKSPKGTGWVRMLSVRTGDPAKAPSAASGVLGLASGRTGTGKVVATTGIRGLGEEDLKAARFDEAELKLLDSYATSAEAARAFAAQGKLAARKLAYLPAPK